MARRLAAARMASIRAWAKVSVPMLPTWRSSPAVCRHRRNACDRTLSSVDRQSVEKRGVGDEDRADEQPEIRPAPAMASGCRAVSVWRPEERMLHRDEAGIPRKTRTEPQ